MWSDDPAHDWDVYCDMQEKAYKALIQDKTCRDCGKCYVNPDDDSAWGWCRGCDDYVLLDESAEDIDCEDFEE